MTTETVARPVQTKQPAAQPSKLSLLLGEQYNVDPRNVIALLRSTVIKPDRNGKQATDAEVAAFMAVAHEYRLNPFTKQIHAFAGKGGGLTPIVGIDGWAAIVNRRPDFDGCAFYEVTDKDGKPISTTCTMYVKGRRHPVQATEWFRECYRKTEPWDQMPHRMLRHKAYMQSARIAFGLSGIHDEDEALDIARRNSQSVAVSVEPPLGRKNLRVDGNGAQAVDEQAQYSPPEDIYQQDVAEAAPERQPGDDDPEPDDLTAEIEKDARAEEITDQIREAGNQMDLQRAGNEIERDKDFLGQVRYQKLIGLFQPRYRELEGKVAPAKRR
ncbi:MAG: recombinase RecT [Terriglobia bacterium]